MQKVCGIIFQLFQSLVRAMGSVKYTFISGIAVSLVSSKSHAMQKIAESNLELIIFFEKSS